MTAILTRAQTQPAAVRHDDDSSHVDRSAGFGQFTTRVWVNGPDSFRFEVTDDGELVATFSSLGEIAMAIYLSDRPVNRNLPTERIAELVVSGIDRVGYPRVADQAGRWEQCSNLNRHQVCTDLADRLIALTQHSGVYPRYPQWQPDWREVVR